MQTASYAHYFSDNWEIRQKKGKKIPNLCVWLQEVREALMGRVEFGDLAVSVEGF